MSARTNRFLSAARLPLLLTGVLAAACGGSTSDKEADSASPVTSGADTIGAAGGTVSIEGATVVVPAGALSAEVDIQLVRHATPADAGAADVPAYLEDVGGVLVLTPHGTTFDVPVTVTMAFDTTIIDDTTELVLVRLDDESDTTWEPVGAFSVGDGEVSFETSTFSLVAAAVVKAGACPCWNGADLEHFYAAVQANGDSVDANASWGWTVAAAPAVGSYALMQTLSGWGGWCKWQADPDDWSTYFSSAPAPLAPATATEWYAQAKIEGDVGSQLAACQSLGARRKVDPNVTNLGVAASGLDSGDAVVVADARGASVTLTSNLTPYWFSAAYAEGESWSVSISSAPADKSCTLDTSSGTFSTDNQVVEVTCVSTSTTACPCSGFTSADMQAAYDDAMLLDNQEIGCFLGKTQTTFGSSPSDNDVSSLEVRGDGGGPEVSFLWGVGKLGSDYACRVYQGESTILDEATGFTVDEHDACVAEATAFMADVGIDPTCAGVDADGDGYDDTEDCDDNDATVHPGANEVCDGRDNDCDGWTDDDDSSVDPSTQTAWCADGDADGYGDPTTAVQRCSGALSGLVADCTDADDADASVH